MEPTVRFAAELGYDVTMVRDATAGYLDEEMHAALDVNIPNYAGATVTTKEVVDSIVSLCSKPSKSSHLKIIPSTFQTR